MSLRVGVDAWNLPHDRRGIGRYVREIVRRWVDWGPQAIRPVLLVDRWPAFFSWPRFAAQIGARVPVRHRKAAGALDLVWYPWNGLSWVTDRPIVATLHDASLFRHPPDPQAQAREQRPFLLAARHARRIITDSEFSKQELIRWLDLDPHRVDVVCLGVDEVFRACPDCKPSLTRYALFVGEPEARKGLRTLLEAFRLLPEQLRQSLELCIAGNTGQYEMPPAPPGTRVTALGWVDDARLAQLYRDAAMLVYPSEYEGFGLPIIEAMAAGTPVIAADTQSSREAGGAAALYAPPRDAAAFAANIMALCAEPALVSRLREAGLARVERCTWERTARETMSVLQRAADECAAISAS